MPRTEDEFKDSGHLHRLLMKPENEPARRAYARVYRALMACESALDRISRRDVYGSLQEEIDEMRRMAREGQELARAAWRLPEEKE